MYESQHCCGLCVLIFSYYSVLEAHQELYFLREYILIGFEDSVYFQNSMQVPYALYCEFINLAQTIIITYLEYNQR